MQLFFYGASFFYTDGLEAMRQSRKMRLPSSGALSTATQTSPIIDCYGASFQFSGLVLAHSMSQPAYSFTSTDRFIVFTASFSPCRKTSKLGGTVLGSIRSHASAQLELCAT